MTQTGLRPVFLRELFEVLKQLNAEPFVVVLVSNPNRATVIELAALSKREIYALVIFITLDGCYPATFANLGSERLKILSVSPDNWVQL